MLYPFKESHLWGMINERGEVIIEPLFEMLSNVIDGYAVGKKLGKWIYIDGYGNEVKSFNVDEMGIFHQGRARMSLHGCVGFINKRFQVVIEPKYSIYTYNFKEGLASVGSPRIDQQTLYGFIDKKGRQVIDYKYQGARDFNEGLAVVCTGNKVGAIDKNDKLRVKAEYHWLNDFKEDRAFFKRKNLWGIVDSKGNEIVEPKFEFNYGEDDQNDPCEHYEYEDFNEGFARIYRDNKFGYIHKNGNMSTDIIYDEATPFSEGYAFIKLEDKWTMIDKKFNTIAKFEYDDLGDFKDGMVCVCIDKKWGCMNKKWEIVIEPLYDEYFEFYNGLAATMLDGRYGYIDKTGKEIFRAENPCAAPNYCFII